MPASPLAEICRVGLTGGIATGKSHVRANFEALGVPTIDADTLAREAVAPGSEGLAAVVARFGRDVLDPFGAIDRRRLASIVFADTSARHDLEGIIHPFVRRKATAWFNGLDAGRHPFAIADIPLLYETGGDRDYDVVVVTACDAETQVRRVMARDHVTEAEARQRLAAQLPIEQKTERADYVINTDGTFADTEAQVKDVFERLRTACK